MTSSNGKDGEPRLITNDMAIWSRERERNAHARLEYLLYLKPSSAAPLTEEDLAIYGMFLQQNPERFGNYVAHAYVDYFPFFIGEVAKAREIELEKFT